MSADIVTRLSEQVGDTIANVVMSSRLPKTETNKPLLQIEERPEKKEDKTRTNLTWTYELKAVVDIQDPVYFPIEILRRIEPHYSLAAQRDKRRRVREYLLRAVDTALSILGSKVHDIVTTEEGEEATQHVKITFLAEGAFGKECKCRRRPTTIETEVRKQIAKAAILIQTRESVVVPTLHSCCQVLCFAAKKSRNEMEESIEDREVGELEKSFRILKKDVTSLSPEDVCLRYAELDELIEWEDIRRLPTAFRVKKAAFIRQCCEERETTIFEQTVIENKVSFLVACSERLMGRTAGIGKTNFCYWYLKRMGFDANKVYEASSTANTWDEYKTQPAVLLDDWGELGTRISNDEFKQLTDPHPKTKRGKFMPARYHNKAIIATTFAINTPLTVDEFVGKFNSAAQGGEGQIYRRMAHIFEFELTQVPNMFAIYEYTYDQEAALSGSCMLVRSLNPVGYSTRYPDREPLINWVEDDRVQRVN